MYVDFALNHDYIAKELCENKEVVKSNCNGKCYLATQLEAQQEDQKKGESHHRFEKLEVLFCSSNMYFGPNEEIVFTLYQEFFQDVNQFYTKDVIDRIYHPPQVA